MAFPGTYNINYYEGDTYEFIIYPKIKQPYLKLLIPLVHLLLFLLRPLQLLMQLIHTLLVKFLRQLEDLWLLAQHIIMMFRFQMELKVFIHC